ncbi:MAG: hypothetical protein CVU05_15400, partial [Bacteroidetes bacterium HGW-Bacteroidetes-21]
MVCPVNLAATEVSYENYTANWIAPAVGVVNNYYIEVATDAQFINKLAGYDPLVLSGTYSSASISGLEHSSTYYYRVRANKSSLGDEGGYHYTTPIMVETLSPPGNALDFDGVNDYVAGEPFTMQIDNVSIEAWVKWNGVEAGQNQIVVYNGNTSSSGFGLFINSGDNYEISLLCGGASIATSDYKLSTGVWTHLAVVRNGGTWTFYANGIPYSLSENPIPLTISASDHGLIGGNVSGTEPFGGQMDEVRIWEIALSACDIAGFMHSEMTGEEDDLVAYFNFNQGVADGDNTSITNLTDISLNEIDATLFGLALNGTVSNFVASNADITNYAEYDGGFNPIPDIASLPDITDGCSVNITTFPTATDACEGVITATTTTVFPITLQGTTVITWNYDDGYGNTVSQTQNVIIDDVDSPVPDVASLPDLTDECMVNPTSPTATDNCSGTINATTVTSFPITTQGTTVITWSYDDGNGNIFSQTQNVIIDDVTDPVPNIATLPDLAADCSITPIAPTASDNCLGIIDATTSTSFPINALGTTAITWTYDDGNGNVVTQNQNVLIDDVHPPVPDNYILTPGMISITISQIGMIDEIGWEFRDASNNVLLSGGPYSIGTYTVSSFNGPYTFIAETQGSFNDNSFSYNLTCNGVSFLSGSISGGQYQTFSAIPTCGVEALDELPTAYYECNANIINPPTATDECAGIVTGTTTDPLIYNSFGDYIITWTYTDNYSNSFVQTQHVVIQDINAPVPDVAVLPNVVGECSATVTNVPTATDACEGSITATTTDALFYDVQGTYTITWAYNDGNSNISYQQQTVIVDDVTPPVFDLATLPDLTVGCTAVMPTSPTATDACEGIITGTTTTIFPVVASTVITWSYDDGNGNVITQNQNIVIDDAIAPVPDVTLLPDVSDLCSVTPTVPTATDNCSGVIDGTTTTIFPLLHSSVVTWTYVDDNGNVATQDQNIIITDNTAPDALCQDLVIELDENGNADLTNETIYFTGTYGNKIWSFDGTSTSLLYPNAASDYSGPVGIEYVPQNGQLYWGGGNQHEIYYALADGSGTPDILTNSQIGGEHHDLDIDYPNNRYFFSAGSDGIYVANLDNSGTSTQVIDAEYAIGLEYNATDQKLYFTEVNNNYISTVSDDGNDYTVLYDNSVGVNGPRDLVIDEENSLVYWVNKGTNSIMVGNMDGSGTPSTLYSGQTGIFGLYLLKSSQMLYWTTFSSGSNSSFDVIKKAPANGIGTPVTVVSGSFGSIRGLFVYSQSIDGGSTDNCAIASAIIDHESFDCSNIGSNAVIMTVTDHAGNVSTCTSTVTVVDLLSPVPDVAILPDVVGICSVSSTTIPTATDNCSGPITGTTSDALTYDLNGLNIVTWSFEDASGNITTQTQRFILTDAIPPIAMSQDIELPLDLTGNASIVV